MINKGFLDVEKFTDNLPDYLLCPNSVLFCLIFFKKAIKVKLSHLTVYIFRLD